MTKKFYFITFFKILLILWDISVFPEGVNPKKCKIAKFLSPFIFPLFCLFSLIGSFHWPRSRIWGHLKKMKKNPKNWIFFKKIIKNTFFLIFSGTFCQIFRLIGYHSSELWKKIQVYILKCATHREDYVRCDLLRNSAIHYMWRALNKNEIELAIG